ncbi:MAG: hypothetical protein HY675_07085 [Chloroflexi bacterium]|nr:hypothetical protein [Chloroflexota bacterium]
MPAYESGDFDPPAPVVRAKVFGPDQTVYRGVPLLLDTGADISVIPLDVATAVGAVIHHSSVPVEFLGGERMTCAQGDLVVEFLKYRFQGRFLLAESAYGVLGRNVLNLLLLTIDGPNLLWSA